ncbi:LacI family transcriptional regulator [Pseudoclavibacter sp. AY1F1]|uniref:LacI family DNA-binding transcriptional regulator n=1 Tax=Pseudoclavibacter sp. AY1F1 TaxID=2080583 RepID=UPI000CE8A66E|nr:LacI family DNA-binding transcriptional regulator [Pseudoclavibacter sp. AY1F1]PPF43167.1 LacI family transcriptional regulator [Pseudoclavibacter sp. AY1F1]
MRRNDSAVAPGAGERRVVTLKQVAAEAGVSISTVSRILDERAAQSQSVTAVRVREIANELGYRRNVFASQLRRGSTSTIGVLVPRLSDTVMALMYEAIERAAAARGYVAVVATTGDDAEGEQRAAQVLLDRNVDALIIASSRRVDSFPQSLQESGIPLALVLRTDGVSPSSLGDDEVGGYLAVRHLIDLGHRDIALVTGPDFTSSARDRLAGALRAAREAHVEIPEHRIAGDGFRIEHGAAAAERILNATNVPPTAIFAANDNLALGVMAASHRHGLRIGTDLALVGYNDVPLAEALPVPLTSVRTSFDQIATTALELLLTPGVGPAIRRAMPTLIPRASSCPPPHR